MDEYIFGMECLATLLYDGSHTTISPIVNCSLMGITDPTIINQFAAKFVTHFTADYPMEAMDVIENVQRNDGVSLAAKARQ